MEHLSEEYHQITIITTSFFWCRYRTAHVIATKPLLTCRQTYVSQLISIRSETSKGDIADSLNYFVSGSRLVTYILSSSPECKPPDNINESSYASVFDIVFGHNLQISSCMQKHYIHCRQLFLSEVVREEIV